MSRRSRDRPGVGRRAARRRAAAGRRTLPLLLAGVLAGLGAGCGRGPQLVERPLLDGLHEPDVLTESPLLEPPPATGGNRFVRGWLPWIRRNRLAGLIPAPGGGRLELVRLEDRRGLLLLDLELTPEAVGREAAVRVGPGRERRLSLRRNLRIPLPAGLPLGRVPIDLELPAEGVAVRAARTRSPRPAGTVRFETGGIVQGPCSYVDLIHELPDGGVLAGRFASPGQRGDDQRFGIRVEAAGTEGERELFAWDGGGGADFRLELPPTSGGPVRIRLTALGDGPPGRWEEMRLLHPPEEPPPTAPPKRPRIVVLYVFDALRADHLGHLGGRAELTPTLDRLAAEGVTFTDHISVAPNTKPSIKSLFTGEPFLLRGHERLPAEGAATLAETFAAAGYSTAAFSGSPWVGPGFGTSRGFEHRSAKATYRIAAAERSGFNDNAERVHRAALEWLDVVGPDRRALLYLHTMHPHNPYRPPPPWNARFTRGIESKIDGGTRTLLAIRRERRRVSAADRERLAALYAANLAYNDAELDGFARALAARYPRGEVLLVLTSDHGEELFDHGGVLHGYTLYREQLHVPLIFWWPGRLAPRRVEAGTDHLDLHATLTSLAGGGDGGRSGHGLPLWGLLDGSAGDWPKRVRFAAASSVDGGIFMARSARRKLVLAPRVGLAWGMGQGLGRSHDAEYLFDVSGDPGERRNLAGERSLEADWLRARLLAWVERGKLTELGSDGPEEIDPEVREQLRALGYVD